jgi:hypothetical protein
LDSGSSVMGDVSPLVAALRVGGLRRIPPAATSPVPPWRSATSSYPASETDRRLQGDRPIDVPDVQTERPGLEPSDQPAQGENRNVFRPGDEALVVSGDQAYAVSRTEVGGAPGALEPVALDAGNEGAFILGIH